MDSVSKPAKREQRILDDFHEHHVPATATVPFAYPWIAWLRWLSWRGPERYLVRTDSGLSVWSSPSLKTPTVGSPAVIEPPGGWTSPGEKVPPVQEASLAEDDVVFGGDRVVAWEILVQGLRAYVPMGWKPALDRVLRDPSDLHPPGWYSQPDGSQLYWDGTTYTGAFKPPRRR